jgi:hypothetical protein
MAIGEQIDNRFDGLLPDDGVYTIRVFLYRAAARRNEASDFTLSVGVTGTPLKPVPAKTDAVLPGTRYHASTTVPCEPPVPGRASARLWWCGAASTARRRSNCAGMATWKRRILFVKGEPKAADVPQAMTFTRNERGWRVTSTGRNTSRFPSRWCLVADGAAPAASGPLRLTLLVARRASASRFSSSSSCSRPAPAPLPSWRSLADGAACWRWRGCCSPCSAGVTSPGLRPRRLLPWCVGPVARQASQVLTAAGRFPIAKRRNS